MQFFKLDKEILSKFHNFYSYQEYENLLREFTYQVLYWHYKLHNYLVKSLIILLKIIL